MGYVATLPTCGPLLILPPALKRWGPPKRQGLSRHLAHLWATFDSTLLSEALRTPKRQGYVATFRTCGPHRILPRFEAVGTPQTAGVM